MPVFVRETSAPAVPALLHISEVGFPQACGVPGPVGYAVHSGRTLLLLYAGTHGWFWWWLCCWLRASQPLQGVCQGCQALQQLFARSLQHLQRLSTWRIFL
jgi:hypothetical protein